MITDKSKKTETTKNENKKMHEKGSLGRDDSREAREDQTPNKFSHRPNKEETYEPKYPRLIL